MVRLVTDTAAPATMDVVDRIRSAPEVPTVPSTMRVLLESVRLNHVAVPVLSADVSPVMELAVSTPPEADGAKVDDRARSASRVLPDRAVSGLAGWVPL